MGLPVEAQIPNDYRGVHEALTDGKPVNARTELGKCYSELARRIRSQDAGTTRPRRFVEYFSLTPARCSIPDRP
jgi:hypothetical protein